MSLPTGYSVFDLGRMISCEPRTSAYAQALREAITPGCRVIDIGTGTGFFAILACHYGAGSVVAIEAHDGVELLPEMAKANDCAGKITVFKGLSTNWQGPDRADVIISDLRGCLPIFGSHLPSIIDARERLLAPGGRLIPLRDELKISVVENIQDFAQMSSPWMENNYGLDLSSGFPFVINRWVKTKLQPSAMLSDEHSMGTLDYSSIQSPNLSAETKAVIVREGTAHGVAMWFDAALSESIGYSNAPTERPLIYGQAFFPFPKTVPLKPGDSIEFGLRADLIDESYIYTWSTKIWRQGLKLPFEQFRQSTFSAGLLTSRKMRRQTAAHVPSLCTALLVDKACLSLIDGQTSLSDIAEKLQRQFPAKFADSSEALMHVRRVIDRYGDDDGEDLSPNPPERAFR